MRQPSFRAGACTFLLAAACSVPVFASSLHTFDATNEDWQVVSYPFRSHVAAPGLSSLPFDGAFGNPAGSVRVGDVQAETGIAAPADHLGDQSSVYGDTLRYDILIRFSDNVAYPAVVLNGGTKSLYYDTPSPALDVWESRAVPLSEAGWKVSGTFAVATQSDFLDVLSNLVGIYIYTEWHTGDDDTSVDNISLPVGGPTGVGTPAARGVLLRPVYPNPSGGTAEIAISLREPGLVSVAVFDVRGRRVRTVAADRLVVDTATLTWDGRTEGGEKAPAGVYFARVTTTAGDVAVQKIVRIR